MKAANKAEAAHFEANGLCYSCTYSKYPTGEVGEVFISNAKVNSASDASAKDSAIAASLALQAGIPLDTISCALLKDARGNPGSALGAALAIIARMESEP